ncbi:MAG: hypothetical protein NVS2B11_14070 [Acetobacteraceae bacterium]
MGEIVNLRRVKKWRVREAEAAEAAVNRALHGRTKAERDAQRKQRAAADRTLDGAALTGDGEPRE